MSCDAMQLDSDIARLCHELLRIFQMSANDLANT